MDPRPCPQHPPADLGLHLPPTDPLEAGDPVTVRVIDYDWSDATVYTLNSRKGDPLAIRKLSETIKPTRGGTTTLVFASDFKIPELPKP